MTIIKMRGKLVEALSQIAGAKLVTGNENNTYEYDFIELKIFESSEIDEAKELAEKCGFEIVDEEEKEENSSYLIYIKPRE